MNHRNSSQHPPQTAKLHGPRIRTIFALLLCFSVMAFLLLWVATIQISHRYQAMRTATDSYLHCEEDAAHITEGSDYLTEQVRLFVMTLDETYLDNYFTEINVTQRRENALDDLSIYHPGHETLSLLQSALEHSDQLSQQEIYAMKLVCVALDLDPDISQLQEMQLTTLDEGLNQEALITSARALVFSTAYQNAKALISEDTDLFLSTILEEMQDAQDSGNQALQGLLWIQRGLILLLFAMSSTTFVLLIVLVVTPLLQNIQLVSQGKPMGVNGAYEIRFLAQTYNDVLAMSGAQKDLLRYQAEHDPLTGTMNRGAFDKLRQIMGPDTTPMTMLMVDIDKFKEINDCYGHETGDRVLQRVAQLLQDSFHARDFTMRLGGDEFSIFLPGSTIAQRAWIEAQVCQINSQLRNPTDGLPPVSISVGVAFSSAGFTDDLYTHTDQALYQVKESGRCGCGFYEECA